jgi:hypothetical protein
MSSSATREIARLVRSGTALVNPIAEVNNYLLALWLIVPGTILIRWRAAAGVRHGVEPTDEGPSEMKGLH